jgi:ADP-L-glycero-D-manno-heptose 6-epimerase
MILITGSDGFIGSNLVERVDNDDIFRIEFKNCFEDLENVPWNNITKIYHLGAISNTTERDINKIFTYNINFSLRLFDYARQYRIPLVYASSASVYGNSFTYAINPINYYSLSKATIDYHVLDNIKIYNNIVGLRFFNVYGPGEAHKGTQASPIHQFTKQALEIGTIKIFEDSEKCLRDFVSIDDVIDCILTEKDSGIYDVGTSNPISFKEVAEIIAEKYSADIKVIPFPENLKNKYQFYTCARNHFDKKFISVKEYIDRN